RIKIPFRDGGIADRAVFSKRSKRKPLLIREDKLYGSTIRFLAAKENIGVKVPVEIMERKISSMEGERVTEKAPCTRLLLIDHDTVRAVIRHNQFPFAVHVQVGKTQCFTMCVQDTRFVKNKTAFIHESLR